MHKSKKTPTTPISKKKQQLQPQPEIQEFFSTLENHGLNKSFELQQELSEHQLRLQREIALASTPKNIKNMSQPSIKSTATPERQYQTPPEIINEIQILKTQLNKNSAQTIKSKPISLHTSILSDYKPKSNGNNPVSRYLLKTGKKQVNQQILSTPTQEKPSKKQAKESSTKTNERLERPKTEKYQSLYERFQRIQELKTKRLESIRQMKKEYEELAQKQYTFRPDLSQTKKSEQKRSLDQFLSDQNSWLNQHNYKMKAMKSEMDESLRKSCTYSPSLSANTTRILMERGSDVRIEDRLLNKYISSIERIQQKREEMLPSFQPFISPRSRDLARLRKDKEKIVNSSLC